MLQICGVTFDHTTNYGSCLQAYALQTVINGMKIEGETCDYALVPVGIIRQNEISANKQIVPLKRRIKQAPISWIKKRRRNQFKGFEEQKLKFVNCSDRNQLFKLNDQFDAFVCGSDVIWNFTYTKGESIYFLDFAEKYKFSYAASFGQANMDYEKAGIALPEPADVIYQRYLTRLDQISVREEYAKKIVLQYTDREAEVVCDPTLLLTAEDWLRISDKRRRKGKYIFAYSTSTRPNFISFLKQLKKQTGLPVVQVTWLIKDGFRQRSMTFPSPEQWLSLLMGAEYVVTNSFHGTAFSLIFKKKFYTAIQGERNVRSNVRLYDFLEDMGLESRLYSQTPEKIVLDAPDFTVADAKIAEIRERSMQYLRFNLENALRQKRDREARIQGTEAKEC